MFNHVMDFIFTLSGILQVIGCASGLLFLCLLYWLGLTERGHAVLYRLGFYDEYRCLSCKELHGCSSAFCASFPCEHFVRK